MKKWIKQHFDFNSHAMPFLLIAGVLLFICAYFLWIALDTRALQGLSGEELAQRLFRQRTVVFISILVLYFLLLQLFWLIRNHMENRAFRLMSKQYRIIDAISSIFTTILLVDLEKDTLEVISAPDFLLDSLNSGKSAETVLDQWASQYVAEAYVKKHHEFMDCSTARERLKEHCQRPGKTERMSAEDLAGLRFSSGSDQQRTGYEQAGVR